MGLWPSGLVLVVGIFLLAAACDIVSPWLVRNFLATFEADPFQAKDAYIAGAWLAGIGWAGFYIFQYLGYTANNYFQTFGMSTIYNELHNRVQHAPYLWHVNRQMGATVVQINRAVRGYEIFTDRLYLTSGLLVALAVSVGATTILAFQYPLIALVISSCLGTGTVALIWLTITYTGPANRRANEEESRIGGALADRLLGNISVKAFAGEEKERRTLVGLVACWRVIEYRSWGRAHLTGLLYEFFLVLALFSGVYLCVQYVQAGQMPLSDVAMVFFTITTINAYTRQLGRIMLDMQKALNDIEDGAYLYTLAREPGGAETSVGLEKGIGFDKVRFSYPEKEVVVLDIPQLVIPKGQKVGLLGHSGAGKSTLVNLLMGFYRLENGAITLDDTPLTALNNQSLRQQMALIPQDTMLFHRSLLENIRYGRPEATEADVIAAAKKAHAHEFIKELPQGYDTLVGERGVKLSGGQRQRIAIARAVLKEAPILILDEATSALDTESEKLIQESLHTLMEGKTVVAIAHRLSTIYHLDRLLVMKGGKIVEDGTHAELLAKNGLYAKLWKMQSGDFIPE